MVQHLFYSGTYLFALAAQADQFVAHGLDLLFALIQLLAQAGGIALGGGLGLAGRFQQLDGAQDFFFQRLEIGVRGAVAVSTAFAGI